MDMPDALVIFASFAGAAIGSLLVYRHAKKQILLEGVTKERSIYRDKMREAVRRLLNAELYTNDFCHQSCHVTRCNAIRCDARDEIIMRLNPKDNTDKALIVMMNQIIVDPDNNEYKQDFIYAIQKILKHDWERSKRDCGESKLSASEIESIKPNISYDSSPRLTWRSTTTKSSRQRYH